MPLVLILLLLALLVGGAGLLIEGLMWLLIISVILFIAGGITGFTRRGGPGPRV